MLFTISESTISFEEVWKQFEASKRKDLAIRGYLELFLQFCKEYGLNPLTVIRSVPQEDFATITVHMINLSDQLLQLIFLRKVCVLDMGYELTKAINQGVMTMIEYFMRMQELLVDDLKMLEFHKANLNIKLSYEEFTVLDRELRIAKNSRKNGELDTLSDLLKHLQTLEQEGDSADKIYSLEMLKTYISA